MQLEEYDQKNLIDFDLYVKLKEELERMKEND